jgi:exodeoxyribonuclease VIII
MHHAIRPGVYDLTNDAYHSGPGVSKSSLDLIHKSAELFAFVHSDEAPERESTPAQDFGTAYHMIVLEPDLFYRTYTLGISMADAPEAIDDREQLVAMVAKLNEGRLPKLATSGSKAELVARILEAQEQEMRNAGPGELVLIRDVAELEAKKGAELKEIIEALNVNRAGLLSVSGSRHDLAALLRANGVAVTLWSDVQSEWLRNNEGRRIISAEDWKTLHAMRDKLMEHPAAGALLRKPGRCEMSFYAIDAKTGELVRCRPDYFTDCGLALDLKSALDASFDGFVSAIQNHRYDVQHPFYIDTINAAIEQAKLKRERAREFIFIAQEKKPPYAVGVYCLDPEDVELGRLEYRADLQRLQQCRESNRWPGYGDNIQRISLKAWHRNETANAVKATLQ